MNNERRLVERLLAQFTPVLRDRLQIEHIDVAHEPLHRRGRANLSLSIPLDGESVTVRVEVMRNVFPRDMERVRWQLATLAKNNGAVDQVMVWAESLSEGARKSLASMGIGYFDSSGSLALNLGRWQILIDRAPIKPRWRDVGTIFSPERAKVLHALLLDWRARHSGVDLVEASEASPNTVSVLMRELERRGMVHSEGNGRSVRRKLVAPEELLNAWAQYRSVSKQRKTRWFAFTQNPASLPTRLAERMGEELSYEWAFAGQYAANSLTPLLTTVNGYDLMVPAGLAAEVAQHLELKSADRGFNVTIHESEDFALQHRIELKDCPGWFASPVVLYLDLVNAGGRGPELAEVLKKNALMNGAKMTATLSRPTTLP